MKKSPTKSKLCLYLNKFVIVLSFCFLSACAKKEYVPIHKVVKTEIPNFLLMETTFTSPASLDTNADLINLLLQYQEALNLCNADKAEIRKFVE